MLPDVKSEGRIRTGVSVSSTSCNSKADQSTKARTQCLAIHSSLSHGHCAGTRARVFRHCMRLGRSEGFKHDRTNPYVTAIPAAKTRADTRRTAGVSRLEQVRPRDKMAKATWLSTRWRHRLERACDRRRHRRAMSTPSSSSLLMWNFRLTLTDKTCRHCYRRASTLTR